MDELKAYHKDFDLKREKNISNRVFSQGKRGLEHRKKEKLAKNKRLGIEPNKDEKPRLGP